IIFNLRPSSTDAWLDQHVDYNHWNRYHTVIEAIRSFDVQPNLGEHLKNRAFYFKPTPGTPLGLMQTLPWDADTSWGPNWNEGEDYAKQAIFDPMRPAYLVRYRNTIRDFRDLIYQPDQMDTLLDRLAEKIAAFVPADRDRWRSAPASAGSENTGAMTTKLADMKTFAWVGGTWVGETGNTPRPNGTDDHLDGLAADPDIPVTPTITYTGLPGFPVNGLSFQSSAFSDPQGNGTFEAMEWRIGQVYDTNAPNHDFSKLMIFEYDLIWGSGTLSNFNNAVSIPAGALEVGLTYRARVRFRDNTERWSHWSSPVEFSTFEASNLAALTNHLRVTEVMYNAPPGSDFDYIEFHNTSALFPLVLDGVSISEGVSYTFPPGTVLSQGQYLVVAKLPGVAFDNYYGTAGTTVLGPYTNNLSNGGEEIEVEPPGGGVSFIDFDYSDGRGWPVSPDGAGHSRVPLLLADQQDRCLDHAINWRASAYIRGSPGAADPVPPQSVVINEFAAHTDFSDTNFPAYDSDDWIELYNPEVAAVNLTNHFLSDDPAELKKWEIPAQPLTAADFVSFSEVMDFHNPITSGFGLDKAGEQIY
ncbi:MAG: lamin tail domain-containing protein, partial [Verrucomicrobiota bacterium]